MKNLFTSFQLTAATVLLMLTAACASVSDVHTNPFWVKEFTMDEPGILKVETSGGNIQVAGHEGNKVRIEMHVSMNGRKVDSLDAKAEEALEDYDINIHKAGNLISAIAERKNSGWFFGSQNTSISFRVLVPQAMAADLSTSGGSISLEGVMGTQELQTSGGNLTIKQVEGDVEAKTSGGGIHVERYKGALMARTSGGTINLSEASGKLDVSTSGGSIKLKDVSGKVNAHTSGGSINANILALSEALTLNTSGGSIHATIPKGLGLSLDLKGNRVHTALANFDGEVEDDKVIGSMNGGGIPVKLSTSGGSINLEYQ